MKKGKVIIQHRFLNRYTVLGAILLTVYGMIMSEGVIGGIFGIVFQLIFHNGTLMPYGMVVGALVILAIHKRWFYPEFEGNLRGGRPGLGFRLALSALILWCTVPFEILRAPENYGLPTAGSIGLALAAGFCEEAAFRGLPLSYLMRQWKDESKIIPAVLLTSGLFGLSHGSNIFGGAGVGRTILQVAIALMIGVFLGAVYLRSGNLWPAITVHTINDVLAFLDTKSITEGVMVGSVTVGDLLALGQCAILCGIGFWLIRPEKRGEIIALWREKWQPLPGDEMADEGKAAVRKGE